MNTNIIADIKNLLLNRDYDIITALLLEIYTEILQMKSYDMGDFKLTWTKELLFVEPE